LLLCSNPVADAFSFLYPLVIDACTELPSWEGYLRSEAEGNYQRSRCPSSSLILPFQLSTERRRLGGRPSAVSARSLLMRETSSTTLRSSETGLVVSSSSNESSVRCIFHLNAAFAIYRVGKSNCHVCRLSPATAFSDEVTADGVHGKHNRL
jgi:hypothetical protein